MGHNSVINEQNIVGKNPKSDLVSINAYIKCGEILSICSQDIEQKQERSINRGHYYVTNLLRNDRLQCQPRFCQYQCVYKFWSNSID